MRGGDSKDPDCVLVARSGQVLGVFAPEPCDTGCRIGYIRGFIAFSAPGYRGQIGGVGLYQEGIRWLLEGCFLDGHRLVEGHNPAERRDETQIERRSSKRCVFTEAMDDAAHVLRLLFAQNPQRVLGRRTRVNDQRLPELFGDCDLSSKSFFLSGVGRVVVVKIESGFADGDHRWVCACIPNRVAERVVEVLGVMRVDSDGSRDSIGMLPRDLDRRLDRRRIARTANAGNSPHARFLCALEHGVELSEEARVIQMAMGVEKHRSA